MPNGVRKPKIIDSPPQNSATVASACMAGGITRCMGMLAMGSAQWVGPAWIFWTPCATIPTPKKIRMTSSPTAARPGTKGPKIREIIGGEGEGNQGIGASTAGSSLAGAMASPSLRQSAPSCSCSAAVSALSCRVTFSACRGKIASIRSRPASVR